MRYLLFSLLFVAALGCSDATQITVEVAHNAPPGDFTLELSVWREGDTSREHRDLLNPVLPATLAVVPKDGALGTIIAEAEMTIDGEARTLRNRATFVEGKNVILLLDFGEASLGDGGVEDDGGSPGIDAGSPDAGTIAPDAGTIDPDAGTIDPDAGTIDPDAGTTEPDAGISGTDAGITGTDAGSPGPACPPLRHDGDVVDAINLATAFVETADHGPVDVLAVVERDSCSGSPSDMTTCIRLFSRVGGACFATPSGVMPTSWGFKAEHIQFSAGATQPQLIADNGTIVQLHGVRISGTSPSFSGPSTTGLPGHRPFAGIAYGHRYAVANSPGGMTAAQRHGGMWQMPRTFLDHNVRDAYLGSILAERDDLLLEVIVGPAEASFPSTETAIYAGTNTAAALGENLAFIANPGDTSVQICRKDIDAGWSCFPTRLEVGAVRRPLGRWDIDGSDRHWAVRAAVPGGSAPAVIHGIPEDFVVLPMPGALPMVKFAVLHNGVAYIDADNRVRVSMRP